MSKISVLMSVYKKENPEYLRASLESILVQTRTADEILLIERWTSDTGIISGSGGVSEKM